MKPRADWFSGRNRGVFLTIRDTDCAGLDARRLAEDLHRMHVSYTQFFASGYVTTHPTSLPYLRRSPYLGDRDLVAEIVAALHEKDIKAIPAIELGVMPTGAGDSRPEWRSLDAAGRPYQVGDDLYGTCALSGYVRDFSAEIVGEILDRYDADGIYFTGFGWRDGICFCESCRREFAADHGSELPREKDWGSPLYRTYVRWRMARTAELSRIVVGHVKAIAPHLPVLTGGVYFGDPKWTMRASLDIESYAAFQDGVFSEAQTRLKNNPRETLWADWQPLIWPGEAARYLGGVSGEKPIWITASYFLAWPWRRTAVSPVEQKLFLAQIAANGASIKVNLSGGPPATHQDRRGFPVMEEMFGFLEQNNEYYQGDRSLARVAIVYSQDTLIFYGKDDPDSRYLDEIRGMELALLEAHIPFDIISTRTLKQKTTGERYDVLLLPTLACLSEKEADCLRDWVDRGKGLVASHETSLFDQNGQKRDDFLLSDLFAASYGGRTPDSLEDPSSRQGPMQCYAEISDPAHPILAAIGDTDILPIKGEYCVIHADTSRSTVPLKKGPAFRVFPEGFAYTEDSVQDEPLAVTSRRPAAGAVVYYPFQIGKMFWHLGLPDFASLLIGAVRWAGFTPRLEVRAPSTVHVSYRAKGNRRIVHLINLTGGRRFFREHTEIRDIEICLRDGAVKRAFLLAQGSELDIRSTESGEVVRLDSLRDYEVVVFECRS